MVLSANHAKLVSGFGSDGGGNMSFRINNPLLDYVEQWNPTQLADSLASGIREGTPIRDRSGLIVGTTTFAAIAVQPNLEIRVA